jgi:membrane-bound ClpP family serine protease
MPWTALALAAVTATNASPETAVAVQAAGELSNQIIISLICLGLLFVLLEVFIPGGIVGTVGGLLMLVGVLLVAQEYGGTMALWLLLGLIVISVVLLVVGFNLLQRSRFGKSIFLEPSVGSPGEPVTLEAKARISIKPGDAGIALSDLRPSGWAKFGAHRVDVVTRGGFILSGDPIVVVAIDGTRVLVKEKPEAPTTGAG